MDAYLHIGTEKTGTTTIQNFFAQHRSELLQSGVLYPKSPGNKNHIKLVGYAANLKSWDDVRERLYGFDYRSVFKNQSIEEFKANFRQELADEMGTSGASKVVFSSEHCSSRLFLAEEVKTLKALLDEFFDQIHVVIYLRRQDSLLLSSYSTQVICDGRTEPIDHVTAAEMNNYYNYEHILGRWAAQFDQKNVTVRIFDKDELYDRDLIKDFLKVTDIQLNGMSHLPSEKLNTSYGSESLEFLRAMNRHVPRYIDDKINPQRSKLLTYLRAHGGDQIELLTPEQRTVFLSQFEASNSTVAQTYLNRTDRPLFAEPSFSPSTAQSNSLDVERAFEIFAYLWRSQAQDLKACERDQKQLSQDWNSISQVFKQFLRLLKRKVTG